MQIKGQPRAFFLNGAFLGAAMARLHHADADRRVLADGLQRGAFLDVVFMAGQVDEQDADRLRTPIHGQHKGVVKSKFIREFQAREFGRLQHLDQWSGCFSQIQRGMGQQDGRDLFPVLFHPGVQRVQLLIDQGDYGTLKIKLLGDRRQQAGQDRVQINSMLQGYEQVELDALLFTLWYAGHGNIIDNRRERENGKWKTSGDLNIDRRLKRVDLRQSSSDFGIIYDWRY